MVRNKKKTPGRPKKEFISKRPKTKIKSWPGRPRKDQKYSTNNKISSDVVWFVAQSVDDSKKKDIMILLLFFVSFALFVLSLYFTLMRDKKAEIIVQSELAEITNIETGNIDYTSVQTWGEIPPIITVETPATVQAVAQDISLQQQTIVDFYQAVNLVDLATMYQLTDARLEESNVFKTYYSRRWLSNFSDKILAPKIVVSNITPEATTADNPNIKNFSYTLEYVLANNNQKFTEERSTVLIKKGEERKIGKLMCETKWCSMMPFFNPDKYK